MSSLAVPVTSGLYGCTEGLLKALSKKPIRLIIVVTVLGFLSLLLGVAPAAIVLLLGAIGTMAAVLLGGIEIYEFCLKIELKIANWFKLTVSGKVKHSKK